MLRFDTQPALAELRERLAGTLALPGEPGYELSTPWNLAVPMAPCAVIAVADEEDVATTLRFAGDAGLRVVVQCTGHGSPGADKETLVVHTGQLDTLQIDAAARRVRVGAGVVWDRVIEAATPHGLAPLCGAAPHNGVVGVLTGGGIGPLVRTYGLSSDRVLAFDVVTGAGELRRASAGENPDLFWALRGGKNSVGIVTAVELELVELAEIYGGALYFDSADVAAVLRHWSEWAPALPAHANTSIALLQLPPAPQLPPDITGRPTVAVRFASPESAEVCEPLLGSLRAVAEPVFGRIGPMPYAAIGQVHADPVEPIPVKEFSQLLRELPEKAVDLLLSLVGPGSGSPQLVAELRLLGGAYAENPAVTSAFSHRDAAYNLVLIGVPTPETAERVAAHGNEVMTAMAPYMTGGMWPSSLGPEGLRPGVYCYDAATRAQLDEVIARHDPARVLVRLA